MSDFLNVKTTIRGVRPLLMHSAAGADPLSDWAKERAKISKIRQKTEEIHMQLAKLDWYSSFYADENRRPVILGTMIEACCIGGAKRTKQGQVAKASILVNENPLVEHDHPKGVKATIDDFWENAKYRDVRGVMVNRARIMRYRPIFHAWQATFDVMLTELDVSAFQTILENAGRFVGLGDFRPKFGLFEVVSIKLV